jgi:hypothetical protein
MPHIAVCITAACPVEKPEGSGNIIDRAKASRTGAQELVLGCAGWLGIRRGVHESDLRIHPKARLAQFGNDWFQAPDDKLVPLPGLGGIIDRLDPA